MFQADTDFGESLRGNTIGATGLRASERKSACERVSEREGFQRFLRGFQRSSEVFRGSQSLFDRGPENGAFGKPCFCPARKRGFLTKMAKMTNLHSNQ